WCDCDRFAGDGGSHPQEKSLCRCKKRRQIQARAVRGGICIGSVADCREFAQTGDYEPCRKETRELFGARAFRAERLLSLRAPSCCIRIAARYASNMMESSPRSHPLSHVDEYLAIGQSAGVSDIHLGVNAPPLWRLHGTLQPIWTDAPRFTSDQTRALAEGFLSNLHKTHLNERGDADFAYANKFGRYRTSVVRQRLGVDLVFRIINTKVRTMEELGLPEHLKLLTRYQNGLILVTGSVGSGKSTTLAALVEQVNKKRRDHIITLEDPI